MTFDSSPLLAPLQHALERDPPTAECCSPDGELKWLAAYHHACQLASQQPRRGLAKLVSWPDVSELPEALVAPVVRVCALLWRKPTASTLAARVLEADARQTDALLRVLEEFGHVQITTGFAERTDDGENPFADAGGLSPAVRSSGVAKLWSRLLGR